MNSLISMDGNYEGDINVPDLEELRIDDEGSLTEEQLNTVVVPDTFSDIDENVLEVFMHYLRHTAPFIMNNEIDYITEFFKQKHFCSLYYNSLFGNRMQ